MMEPAAAQQPGPNSRWPIGWRPLLFGVAAIGLVLAYACFHHELSLHAVAKREDALRQYQQAHPLLLPLIVLAIYVGATGISIPIGIVLSIGCGWLFGIWEGTVLVSFAATAGSIVAFWISRYLLRDAIAHHFDHLMKSVDELLARDGASYLLSLRLIHIIPSWLINLLMGWTTIRTWTFWWATQLGTLPATIFYVCVGQGLKSLHELADKGGISSLLTPGYVAMFILLAALPLIAHQVIKQARAKPEQGSGETRGEGPRARD
jgi:uncharacterized membrane protein YdjX (TVP38/TMEM64 family)